jgi:hypothetical protein
MKNFKTLNKKKLKEAMSIKIPFMQKKKSVSGCIYGKYA